MNDFELVLCPWCKRQSRVDVTSRCPHCGGPVVLAANRTHPDAPPPAPRSVPAQYRRHVAGFTNDFMTLFGLIWGGIGTLFFVVGLGLLAVFALLGGIFAAVGAVFGGIGWFLVYRGRASALERLAFYENGTPVLGQLVSVERDLSMRKNGRSAFALEYVYEIDGATYGDFAHGFDPANATRRPGEPLWLIVDSADRSRSAPWPPLA